MGRFGGTLHHQAHELPHGGPAGLFVVDGLTGGESKHPIFQKVTVLKLPFFLAQPGALQECVVEGFQRLSSKALAMTLTELSAMAAPAITGLK